MVAPEAQPNGHPAGHDAWSANRVPRDEHQPSPPPLGPHPLEPLMANLADLRRQAEQYVQVTADRLKCTARQMAVRVALACVALLVGATLLVTATVLALYGAAGAVAEALGGRPWAGQLIIGTAFLFCVAIAGWWGSRKFSETSRRKTIDKYERQSFDDLTRNGLRADSTRPVGR